MRCVLSIPAGVHRLAARVVLLALSVTTVGPVLHDVHDAELRAAVVPHDASHHHIAAPAADSSPLDADHCVACHFVRTSRGPVSWEFAGLHTLDAQGRCFESPAVFLAALLAAPRPARAPPLA